MAEFIIFVIVIFVIIPMLTNAKKKPAKFKQKSKTNTQRAKKYIKPSAKYGHSGTRARVHKDLHRGDGDANVFSKSHAARVAARNRRDAIAKAKMKKSLDRHSRIAIMRAGNRGRDDWGARGDRGPHGFGSVLAIFVIGFIIYYLLNSGTIDIGHIIR